MSTDHPDPDLQGEPPGEAKPITSQEWLERWMAEERVAGRTSSWRVSHMMWLVAAFAVVFWIVLQIGALAVLGGMVMLFAISIGAGVILARRRSTQQDSLLWILAIASEANMPLAPTVAAFADQYGGKYRRRIMNLAAELDSGRSVPEALESVRRVVSRDALLMARVGEQTGRLPEALRLAASSRSSQLPIWTAISTRLAYLLTVLLVLQSICGFMMYFIVPKFEAIFKDFGIGLPDVTIWLIEGSHLMIKYGYIMDMASTAGSVAAGIPAILIRRLGQLRRTVLRPPVEAATHGLDDAGTIAGCRDGQADRGGPEHAGQPLSHALGAAQADQG